MKVFYDFGKGGYLSLRDSQVAVIWTPDSKDVQSINMARWDSSEGTDSCLNGPWQWSKPKTAQSWEKCYSAILHPCKLWFLPTVNIFTDSWQDVFAHTQGSIASLLRRCLITNRAHFTTRRIWLICIKCTFREFCWNCKSSTNFFDWGPWAWSEWKKV